MVPLALYIALGWAAFPGFLIGTALFAVVAILTGLALRFGAPVIDAWRREGVARDVARRMREMEPREQIIEGPGGAYRGAPVRVVTDAVPPPPLRTRIAAALSQEPEPEELARAAEALEETLERKARR